MLLKVSLDTMLMLIVTLVLSVIFFFELRAVKSSTGNSLAALSLGIEVRLLRQAEKLSILERQLEIYREEFSGKLAEVSDKLD